jgi:hypothetical protein
MELTEASTPKWMLKKVKNPKTGNMVQVRSLTPKEQEKYRPKSEKKFEMDKKVIKAFAAKNKLGNWTTRGPNTLLNKDTGKKYDVKSADDVARVMGGLDKPGSNVKVHKARGGTKKFSPKDDDNGPNLYAMADAMEDGESIFGFKSSSDNDIEVELPDYRGHIYFKRDGKTKISIDGNLTAHEQSWFQKQAKKHGFDWPYVDKNVEKKPSKNPAENLSSEVRSTIESLKDEMASDYDRLFTDNDEKIPTGKKYWEGLAQMAVEQAADRNKELGDLLDKEPDAYDKIVKHYTKKRMG